ncbi:hypothetical protein [Allokutzneria oryzae]|uniref:Conjugal transfer protein TraB n=1 Tax=Allokutzneria oryzae TaxID=1378989 RepID=A0ABV6A2C7_9PSEU
MGNNGGKHHDQSGAPSPYAVATNRLHVDRDKLPAAIALFKQARDDVDDLLKESRGTLQFLSMAADRVSAKVAEVLSRKGMDGTDSALGAVQAFRNQLAAIVDKLEATLAHYRRLEANNRASFRGGARV